MEFIYDSPVGRLNIFYDHTHILGLYFERKRSEDYLHNPVIEQCVRELDEYFTHGRMIFDIPVNPKGTDFQKATWGALTQIPYGVTVSYANIAAKIGKPKACRAVGGANNKNPISIIVPCHRVVGATGKLVGYGGELWRKQWLLDHEARRKSLHEI